MIQHKFCSYPPTTRAIILYCIRIECSRHGIFSITSKCASLIYTEVTYPMQGNQNYYRRQHYWKIWKSYPVQTRIKSEWEWEWVRSVRCFTCKNVHSVCCPRHLIFQTSWVMLVLYWFAIMRQCCLVFSSFLFTQPTLTCLNEHSQCFGIMANTWVSHHPLRHKLYCNYPQNETQYFRAAQNYSSTGFDALFSAYFIAAAQWTCLWGNLKYC